MRKPNRARKAALAIASKGKPVFPTEDKEPLVKWKDSFTKHPGKIAAWWRKWPKANIAMPTGKASGFLIVDLDTYKPGAMTLAEFEDKYGEISHTLTARTGNGGLQFYLLYPEGVEIRNSAGMLGTHVDVRGEGGYTVVPPSVTTGEYEWINKAPAAPISPKLLEALTEKPTTDTEGTRSVFKGEGTTLNLDGAPIHEGTRNMTLTSIAGYMHDGTRHLEQLIEELLQINEARCTPPLDPEEVAGIAKSIYRLAPCKKSRRYDPPTPAVVGMLRDILRDWWNGDWRGTGGKSDRDILLAYILFAMERGEILPNGGILVDVSHHQVAERARKSSSTAYNAHKRLKVKGWCLGGGNGPDRKEDQPEGIVLLAKPRKTEHPLQDRPTMVGVFDFARVPTARRGRHSAPGLVRIASAGRIAVIDHLERIGAWASERTIADAMCLSRVRDMRRRYLLPLKERGIVERSETGKLWRLSEDWRDALARVFEEEEELERRLYSGFTSDERQHKRSEESRQRWRNRENVHAEKSPSHDELRERRESYPERRQAAIRQAIADLFSARPEYRGRRAGQIACQLPWYLPEDFPRGPEGAPKDSEVEAILDGESAA